MVDYSKGKIYKIEINGQLYVGSTCQLLCQRRGNHVRKSIDYPNRKLYKCITENGGWDNVKLILIINFPCKSIEELLAEEDKYIKELKPELNSKNAVFDKERYVIANKKRCKEYCKEYYIANKEERNAKSREYHRNNREKIKESRKQYREENREKHKEYMKKWHLEHKKVNQ